MFANSMNSKLPDGSRGTSVLASFGNTLVASQVSGENYYNVTYPNGYLNEDNNSSIKLTFKVLFLNGFIPSNSTDYLTLNSDNNLSSRLPIVSYQNGIKNYLPIHEIVAGTYSCVQAGTILELYYDDNYDGNNNAAFVVVGNPVVLSSTDYTIYADGKVGDTPIGTIISLYKQSNPYGYLELIGDTIADMSTKYPKLYTYLGNSNVLPDYREFALVGAGQNSADVYNATTNPNGVIKTHDTYTQGQAKDDTLQHHTHTFTGSQGTISSSGSHTHTTGGTRSGITTGGAAVQSSTTQYVTSTNISGGSHTHTFTPSGTNGDAKKFSSYDDARLDTVTRGKRKAVFFYIKAL